MSFRFNFDVDDSGDRITTPEPVAGNFSVSVTSNIKEEKEQQISTQAEPCEIISLSVPTVSSIVVDAVYYKNQQLWKRQIDDVQFQLAQQDSMDGSNESAMVKAMVEDKNASDVIKGVYEGGLKTWECSIDLLNYIVDYSDEISKLINGGNVLEIGCGTALPSLHILRNISGACVSMQDYNKDVLELVTMPNVLSNTDLEPPSGGDSPGYKIHVDGDTETCEIDLDYRRTQVLFGDNTDNVIGERDIPELTKDEAEAADAQILNYADIKSRCEFIAGDWSEIEKELRRYERQHSFNLILTSETIYETSNYKKLHDLLACALAKPAAKSMGGNEKALPLPMALVAAKTLYFGLTGSVLTFKQYVRSQGIFNIECVWQSGGSMNREILCLTWQAPPQHI
ncbi:hypothetical protein GGI25_002088 [Coemansia spiralis]|uniref:protein-histidine N-methyltransferase n=2 Tax=Coemansia TaxID=4863 RepID=A0A9W8G9C9_9FUNG|nr:hypothetical protein EDC05_005038 [Coemansia umbellata]KAJ2619946.1 hypothetical protein GGI26_005399 [Coemansia sp. RSA 1358]KAJ2678704.1 hypothetical protein GGI25_002088 [Coemansia spiralis]